MTTDDPTILSDKAAAEWWAWMQRVGTQENNSLRASYESLRARLTAAEESLANLRDLYNDRGERLTAAEARAEQAERERDRLFAILAAEEHAYTADDIRTLLAGGSDEQS